MFRNATENTENYQTWIWLKLVTYLTVSCIKWSIPRNCFADFRVEDEVDEDA